MNMTNDTKYVLHLVFILFGLPFSDGVRGFPGSFFGFIL